MPGEDRTGGDPVGFLHPVRSHPLISVVFTMAAAGCALPPAEVTVAVTGPADWEPPEELVLEIGDTAWHGSRGVAGVVIDAIVEVRLVGTESCRRYTTFFAEPGTSWTIRFDASGSARVEDWTGRDIDIGPALPPGELSGCP
jgi:hypothetical protein